MPYISQSRRNELEQGETPKSPGELNYSLSQIIKQYLSDGGNSYTVHNDIVGALECLKLEWYRRFISELEQQKCLENGDVF